VIGVKSIYFNMKAALIFKFTLVIILFTLSCNNQKTDFKLNPKLEIMSDSVIKWNEKEYNINLVDSILLNYKKKLTALIMMQLG